MKSFLVRNVPIKSIGIVFEDENQLEDVGKTIEAFLDKSRAKETFEIEIGGQLGKQKLAKNIVV